MEMVGSIEKITKAINDKEHGKWICQEMLNGLSNEQSSAVCIPMIISIGGIVRYCLRGRWMSNLIF
jgi:glycerol-3-phosphate responsive antiterminator